MSQGKTDTPASNKPSTDKIAADAMELAKMPDGKPADMSKPVKIFILTGQSNMVGLGNKAFIKALRKDLDCPNAKFVMGTIGDAVKGSGNKVMEAQFAADGSSGKHPEFKGNVATSTPTKCSRAAAAAPITYILAR